MHSTTRKVRSSKKIITPLPTMGTLNRYIRYALIEIYVHILAVFSYLYLEKRKSNYERSIQNPVKLIKLELFEKIVNGLKLLTSSAKSYILDVWQGSEYPSVSFSFNIQLLKNNVKFDTNKLSFFMTQNLEIWGSFVFTSVQIQWNTMNFYIQV